MYNYTLEMKVFGRDVSRLRNYMFIGLLAFTVEYLSFIFLFSSLKIDATVAQPLSFLVGLSVSFIGSRFFTFKPSKDETHANNSASQAASFLALGLVNTSVSTALMVLFATYMGVSPKVAKVLIMGMIVAWNYFILGKLIFKTEPAD